MAVGARPESAPVSAMQRARRTGNSATLTGAVLGEDHFHLSAFLANLAVYFLLAAAVLATARAVSAGSARARPNESG